MSDKPTDRLTDPAVVEALFKLLCQQCPEIPAAARLRDGFQNWRRAEGALSLERCLGLANPASYRVAKRDEEIRRAAALLKAAGRRAICAKLKAEWDTFNRLIGPTWRRNGGPPEDSQSSDLYVALFNASFYNGGQSASVSTIDRAVFQS